jgi:hypothetical protein
MIAVEAVDAADGHWSCCLCSLDPHQPRRDFIALGLVSRWAIAL